MSKIRLLYVEDEPTLGQIVKDSLETRHFEVTLAQNGLDGWDEFLRETPDACVLDIMMPELDGLALAKKIRKRNESLPIIFLSAKTQTKDVLSGFSAGGDDYMKKPFSMEELIVRVENLLKRAEKHPITVTETPAVRQIGKYAFDFKKQSLTLGDHSQQLSYREAQMLKMFCDRENEVLERKEVLMELWGDDHFFNARSMDVFITKLRKKLALDPKVKIINLRGVGYKLIS
ncbi:DNA-binding response regulator [Fulvitalea axinellae]|uniref:DNA-binding response regulator n=1 Tax=Fulvitalea axinellae TaxID=1182444 RepID=A0AAU9DD27_9BACT|nr:DNA-binding response regulator [Fulvitalea axinellae]